MEIDKSMETSSVISIPLLPNASSVFHNLHKVVACSKIVLVGKVSLSERATLNVSIL